MNLLTADKKEIVTYWRPVYLLFPTGDFEARKPNLLIEENIKETILIEFLKMNFNGIVDQLKKRYREDQIVYFAEQILIGKYYENKRTGKKHLMKANERCICRFLTNFHPKSLDENSSANFFEKYDEHPLKHLYPFLFPIKVSFDENAVYEEVEDSEIVFVEPPYNTLTTAFKEVFEQLEEIRKLDE